MCVCVWQKLEAVRPGVVRAEWHVEGESVCVCGGGGDWNDLIVENVRHHI